MRPFKQLSFHDNKALFNLPVYIALLAANGDGQLDDAEKLAAIEFAHIKSFSCNPLLKHFYKQAESVFENNLIQFNKALPAEKVNREIAIKKELVTIEKIISKLDDQVASVMHQNMNALAAHVSRAHHNVLTDFIFPIPITGLTI